MAVQLDSAAGELLARKIEKLGLTVHTAKSTQAIINGDRNRYKLQFSDGTSLDADLVLFSAGIRPYDQLAKAAGLNVGARGGIVIDDACQTSDNNIKTSFFWC
jgi:nitrite reductase (NADH) large subunit